MIMECGWGSSEDEGPMEIDLDARQEDNRHTISSVKPGPQITDCDSYDPANPTNDCGPDEPTTPSQGGEADSNLKDEISDYDPADPTVSEDELENKLNKDIHIPYSDSPASGDEKGDLNDQSKAVELSDDMGEESDDNKHAQLENVENNLAEDEEDNDGRWDSQLSCQGEDETIFDFSGKEKHVFGTEDTEVIGHQNDDLNNEQRSSAPIDRDETSQMSAISESINDDNIVDDISDVPDVTFDDSDFVLEKELFEQEEETEHVDHKSDGDTNEEEQFGKKDNGKETALNRKNEEEDEEIERERRREEVACLNEEALVDLFREESEPDKEMVDGEMTDQQIKKVKKKVLSKKIKKKGKKIKKGQGKKGQLSKSYEFEHGDQRFVEISRDRPSVESREEGELDGEGGVSRRWSYEERESSQQQYNYSLDERTHHDDNDPREPGEIVESVGKKKGLKKKDKKEKKKKKSRREVATVEEGNQGEDDTQKFPSFLAGFFVQDGMEDLEGQEDFVNDFDEEDPRSLFAKASAENRHEGSEKGSVRSFENRPDHTKDDHQEEVDLWRGRRHDERRHGSREQRHDSNERRRNSRDRREREHRLDVSVDREKERDRSRSERGRDRVRDRERERIRDKEFQRERERARRSGEERRRRVSRSRSRERRRRSGSYERNRRSRSRERLARHRRRRSRSQDKSAERERERERERARERSRWRRRQQRSRERESERRIRRVSHSKSRSPRRRSERASSNKENREDSHRRRRRQREHSEESGSEERESARSRRQPRRERERSSSASDESSSESSSSPSLSNRPNNNATRLPHLSFQNYSEDEGNSSDVILVEPERIVINLDEEDDPPSRVDITHGNTGDDENATLEDGQSIPPPSELSTRPRSSALVQINPNEDNDTRVVEAHNDGEDVGDATPTRDEVSDQARTVIVSSPRDSAVEPHVSQPVKETDYDPAHPTEEDVEDDSQSQLQKSQQQQSPVFVTQTEVRNPSPSPVEKGPVPPNHPPPEEIRPSPPPIPAETESLHPAQQQPQPLGLALPGTLMNNPVMQLINPLLMQQKQQQMGRGPQPGGGLLPLPNQPPQRFPWQNRDNEGGPPPGFSQGQQRHMRPLLQLPERRGPSFGGQDASPLMHPFGGIGQQPNSNIHAQQNNSMHPRMPISSMPPLAQLTSLLPALEKAKMAACQQQDLPPSSHLGSMFSKSSSLLGKAPLSTSLSLNMSSNLNHNSVPFRFNRPEYLESTEVVDMDMSPGDDDCELELPSPNSDSGGSRDGRGRRRSRRGGNSHQVQDIGKQSAGKGVIQPVAYLKALSKALEKLDPKSQHSQSGSGGQTAHEKGKSNTSKKHKKVDLDDDVPASAVDLTNKEKYLKKLHLQERVIDEVKLAIKPFYNSKKISKEQYKLILRKAVPKVCHCKGGNINSQKIQQLVEAYVMKIIKKQSGGQGGSGKKKIKGSKDGVRSKEVGKPNGEHAAKKIGGAR